ncbi:MAG: hypothetical protein JXM69_08655, partial [Anaerolineae bacterium]|nr:hypothetical protein [Anaerolineae bacterium]
FTPAQWTQAVCVPDPLAHKKADNHPIYALPILATNPSTRQNRRQRRRPPAQPVPTKIPHPNLPLNKPTSHLTFHFTSALFAIQNQTEKLAKV